MTKDSMREDLAQEHDLAFSHDHLTAEGYRLWPELVFSAPDGFRPLTLSVTRPDGPGPFPLVVWIHGGAWRIGHPNVTNGVLRALRITGTLVDAGYAVARISYRMTGEGRFPMQLHDCKDAVRFLRHHAGRLGLDPARFAAMGESAGGHLALMLGLAGDGHALDGSAGGLAGGSAAVACVVDWYGPTEFLTMDAQRPPHASMSHDSATSPEALLIGGAVQDNADLAARASPVTHVTAGAPPILIQHGTADRLVPIGQARVLAERLRAAGAVVELDEVEGADHCFWGVDATPVLPRALGFLDRHLRQAVEAGGKR